MSDFQGLPIIKIEIERMRHAICKVMGEHETKIDTYVNESIDRYVNGGQLQSDIDRHVNDSIRHALKEQIDNFFRCGEGRAAIAGIVIDRLSAELDKEKGE